MLTFAKFGDYWKALVSALFDFGESHIAERWIPAYTIAAALVLWAIVALVGWSIGSLVHMAFVAMHQESALQFFAGVWAGYLIANLTFTAEQKHHPKFVRQPDGEQIDS